MGIIYVDQETYGYDIDKVRHENVQNTFFKRDITASIMLSLREKDNGC